MLISKQTGWSVLMTVNSAGGAYSVSVTFPPVVISCNRHEWNNLSKEDFGRLPKVDLLQVDDPRHNRLVYIFLLIHFECEIIM